jgi:hypothetical protein
MEEVKNSRRKQRLGKMPGERPEVGKHFGVEFNRKSTVAGKSASLAITAHLFCLPIAVPIVRSLQSNHRHQLQSARVRGLADETYRLRSEVSLLTGD